MIHILKGFISTLPRPAPQDLPIFAGGGARPAFSRAGRGRPFSTGRGGAHIFGKCHIKASMMVASVRLPIGKLPCCVVFSCMLTKQLCWEINNPFLALFSNPPLPSFSLLLDDSTIYVGDIPLSTISRFFFASLPYVCRYHCCIFIPSCQSQLLLWTVTIMIVMMMAIQNFEWK